MVIKTMTDIEETMREYIEEQIEDALRGEKFPSLEKLKEYLNENISYEEIFSDNKDRIAEDEGADFLDEYVEYNSIGELIDNYTNSDSCSVIADLIQDEWDRNGANTDYIEEYLDNLSEEDLQEYLDNEEDKRRAEIQQDIVDFMGIITKFISYKEESKPVINALADAILTVIYPLIKPEKEEPETETTEEPIEEQN